MDFKSWMTAPLTIVLQYCTLTVSLASDVILQIYGLENEQKKLEEDTVVYNRLQEQLKLSPAYMKVLCLAQTWP